MALTKDSIAQAIGTVIDPGSGRSLADRDAVKWVALCDGAVNVKVHVPGLSAERALEMIARACGKAARAHAEGERQPITSFHVQFVDEGGKVVHESSGNAPAARASMSAGAGRAPTSEHKPIRTAGGGVPAPRGGLPGVKHIVAVGAGKGGVGKSTVAVNLAVGLARAGHAVGLLDGDIYGPSLPTMLGLGSMELNVVDNRFQPFFVHGIKAISIGAMVEPDKPLIWRGPMAHGAFTQLLEQTAWGELDYLVIDLPPGTGDVPLSMAQSVPMTGAMIVCTPQRVAQDDAVRAVRMFQQLNVDVLGVVENMSVFIGDDGKEYDIFGRGGAEMMAQRLNLPFLGALPINTTMRANADAGDPGANFSGRGAGMDVLKRRLESLVSTLESQVRLASLRSGATKPTLTIS